jgi:hypothetical protein
MKQSGYHAGKRERLSHRTPFMCGYWAAMSDANPYCGVNFIRDKSEKAFAAYVERKLRLRRDIEVYAYDDNHDPDGVIAYSERMNHAINQGSL